MFDKGLYGGVGAILAAAVLFIANQVTELPDRISDFPLMPGQPASSCPAPEGFVTLVTPTGEAAKLADGVSKITALCESAKQYLRRIDGPNGAKWLEEDKETGTLHRRDDLR